MDDNKMTRCITRGCPLESKCGRRVVDAEVQVNHRAFDPFTDGDCAYFLPIIEEDHEKSRIDEIAAEKCLAIYMAYHVSQVRGLTPPVIEAWDVGKRIWLKLKRESKKNETSNQSI